MIDIDNNSYFDMFRFPGGEWGVKWKGNPLMMGGGGTLLSRLNNGDDLLKLLTITNALKNMRVENNWLSVCIPYFPGARQDRISNPGEPLSVKMYADIINAQNYRRVHILDPHSEVTPAVLNNCNVLPVSTILSKIVIEGHYNTILIPDAGAAKKTFNYYFPDRDLHRDLKFVQCLKKRDTVTGKLSGFEVIGEIPVGARCLIVDDICDGGGTFVGLAEALIKHMGDYVPQRLSLYVTHGIFSKGISDILYSSEGGIFDAIYTTDSIRPNQPEGVKVIKL
jgi:ribose-phosphate pyrophosphokinase